jgi:hypothetical protein
VHKKPIRAVFSKFASKCSRRRDMASGNRRILKTRSSSTCRAMLPIRAAQSSRELIRKAPQRVPEPDPHEASHAQRGCLSNGTVRRCAVIHPACAKAMILTNSALVPQKVTLTRVSKGRVRKPTGSAPPPKPTIAISPPALATARKILCANDADERVRRNTQSCRLAAGK